MKFARTAASLAFTAATLALAACGTTGSATSHDAIINDLTPELLTLNQRSVDAENARHITYNSNWRAMWGDINRAMLLDRPSRLAPVPITH